MIGDLYIKANAVGGGGAVHQQRAHAGPAPHGHALPVVPLVDDG